jgi:hypothetical protein
MKLKFGFAASIALSLSLLVSGVAVANDGGIGQIITQSSELLTLSNNANSQLKGSKYKILFFESDGELYSTKAQSHFRELPRDNQLLVGVYVYKDYNGTSTKVRYHFLADKDALNPDQARKYASLVSVYDNKSTQETANQIMSNFVPEFDTNPWTISGKSISDSALLALCLLGLGGLAFLKLIEH